MPRCPATSLLPANPSFAGHQTFALRSGWLKKGLDALQDQETGAETTFARDDAIVTLGVGKNMVQAIKHWLCATRMAAEAGTGRSRDLAPTDLGMEVFGTPEREGWDSYLEDEATVWLLHWQLAGPGSRVFTWVWAFNLYREYEFSRARLADAVHRAAAARVSRPPSHGTVGRDVDCLLHTYVQNSSSSSSEDHLDSPLASLGLIREAFDRAYRFEIGPKPTLPAPVFAYALAEYWRWAHHSSLTVPVKDIMYGEGAPGVVFKLDEDSVLGYLDELARATDDVLRFDDTPQVRQVVRDGSRDADPIDALRMHYGG